MKFYVLVIILIVTFPFYGYFLFEKIHKAKANSRLTAIKNSHNVSLSFVSRIGCLGFCDDERKIYFHQNISSEPEILEYDSILEFEERNYSEFNKDISTLGFSFWALTPHYTEYFFGYVEFEKRNALKEKFISIIDNNSNQAKTEYSKITEIPGNAANVTIKGFNGINVDIPNAIEKMGNVFAWVNDENICLFSKFNFLDFKLTPDIYQPIYIEKKSIVGVSQEGNVHYTTEVQGGGGGGSSIKGAVIGGVIAGEAGAIIGSRKSTDPITSSTKQIDDRTTNVKILDEYNNFCEILFDHNDYYAISKFVGK